MASALGDGVRASCAIRSVRRTPSAVFLTDANGEVHRHDHVVIAAHADEGLAMLQTPSPAERALLSAFRYSSNRAVLHTDERLMPKRRQTWSAWNYLGGGDGPCVTYWMNRLQGLPAERPLFVTLNPTRKSDPARTLRVETYQHPLFNAAALRAQEQLWTLQGENRTWWCGAYFGAGFHEDGLQAGLAVAEALGGARRPWRIPGESDRIRITERPERQLAEAA
jgi:predicted NAD/FAD-binding protein